MQELSVLAVVVLISMLPLIGNATARVAISLVNYVIRSTYHLTFAQTLYGLSMAAIGAEFLFFKILRTQAVLKLKMMYH